MEHPRLLAGIGPPGVERPPQIAQSDIARCRAIALIEQAWRYCPPPFGEGEAILLRLRTRAEVVRDVQE